MYSGQTPPNQEGWTNVKSLEPSIALDIRYATTNNFMGEKIYDCAECYLRTEVAQAIARVHRALKTKGYGGLKMYDCYRPLRHNGNSGKKYPTHNTSPTPARARCTTAVQR